MDDAVQTCNRAIVNVTIKLDDALCREARHRAVDADLSLSGWIAELIRERVGVASGSRQRPASLLDLLGDEAAGAVDLEIPSVPGDPKAVELAD
jgi:hypothetical protein